MTVEPRAPQFQLAREATARILTAGGEHRGQGLVLDLGTPDGVVVLTCHHVIAPVPEEQLRVEVLGRAGAPVRAWVLAEHSDPERDIVALTVEGVEAPSPPRLLALEPRAYTGGLEVRGLTHLTPTSFSATLDPATPLSVPSGDVAELSYRIPHAFRLREATDTRGGISGGVVFCAEGDGVLGLVHFARGATAETEREAFLVPLSAWAEGWPALAEHIQPLIDGALRDAAMVRRAQDLRPGTDVVIAKFRPDVYLKRDVEDEARSRLEEYGRVLIIGRPLSGKSRLAWQLVQERPDLLVVIPKASTPPAQFENAGLFGKQVLLLLDNLHGLSPDANPARWRERLEEATGRTCLLVATARDGAEWKRIEEGEQFPHVAAFLQHLGSESRVYTSRVGDQGKDLSESEGQQLAGELGLSAEEFRRFDHTPGSLILDLEEMALRYRRLRSRVHGTLETSRLLDSVKLLHTSFQPFTAQLIRFAAEHIRGDGRIGRAAWDVIAAATEEEAFGRFDPSTGRYVIYEPYLEWCVEYMPSAEEAEELLEAISRHAELGGDLFAMAVALHQRFRALHQAEEGYRMAIEAGDPNAFNNLGILLAKQPGREADAEAAYRQAIEAGDPKASFNLGILLAGQPGREAEACEAFRKAATGGITEARLALEEFCRNDKADSL